MTVSRHTRYPVTALSSQRADLQTEAVNCSQAEDSRPTSYWQGQQRTGSIVQHCTKNKSVTSCQDFNVSCFLLNIDHLHQFHQSP